MIVVECSVVLSQPSWELRVLDYNNNLRVMKQGRHGDGDEIKIRNQSCFNVQHL